MRLHEVAAVHLVEVALQAGRAAFALLVDRRRRDRGSCRRLGLRHHRTSRHSIVLLEGRHRRVLARRNGRLGGRLKAGHIRRGVNRLDFRRSRSVRGATHAMRLHEVAAVHLVEVALQAGRAAFALLVDRRRRDRGSCRRLGLRHHSIVLLEGRHRRLLARCDGRQGGRLRAGRSLNGRHLRRRSGAAHAMGPPEVGRIHLIEVALQAGRAAFAILVDQRSRNWGSCRRLGLRLRHGSLILLLAARHRRLLSISRWHGRLDGRRSAGCSISRQRFRISSRSRQSSRRSRFGSKTQPCGHRHRRLPSMARWHGRLDGRRSAGRGVRRLG